MNKGNKLHKLGRNKSQRAALLKSLAHDVILHEKITTTQAKAKAVRPYIERLITHAKKDTVASRRIVRIFLSEQASQKLFATIAPLYKDRNGGYIRILRSTIRKIDASKMALIELVK